MKYRKVYYYDNELEDEFSGIKRNTITVDENYRYSHGRLWKVAAWVLYHIIMTPAAFIYMKLRFCMRIEGKDKLCGLRDGGDGRVVVNDGDLAGRHFSMEIIPRSRGMVTFRHA